MSRSLCIINLCSETDFECMVNLECCTDHNDILSGRVLIVQANNLTGGENSSEALMEDRQQNIALDIVAKLVLAIPAAENALQLGGLMHARTVYFRCRIE